jgi:hypothetical protein
MIRRGPDSVGLDQIVLSAMWLVVLGLLPACTVSLQEVREEKPTYTGDFPRPYQLLARCVYDQLDAQVGQGGVRSAPSASPLLVCPTCSTASMTSHRSAERERAPRAPTRRSAPCSRSRSCPRPRRGRMSNTGSGHGALAAWTRRHGPSSPPADSRADAGASSERRGAGGVAVSVSRLDNRSGAALQGRRGESNAS